MPRCAFNEFKAGWRITPWIDEGKQRNALRPAPPGPAKGKFRARQRLSCPRGHSMMLEFPSNARRYVTSSTLDCRCYPLRRSLVSGAPFLTTGRAILVPIQSSALNVQRFGNTTYYRRGEGATVRLVKNLSKFFTDCKDGRCALKMIR